LPTDERAAAALALPLRGVAGFAGDPSRSAARPECRRRKAAASGAGT
jgi:hypothetical protein